NVRIGPGTQILAFSHLEDSEIGARCRVGPYARLRPGNSLDDEVHVGNFVELKASRIGKGSKANHLSYIGDSEVGAAGNVGAGTITCNYDGAAKHRTIIEDECFIGSDTTLVAPVRVARGSYIGAGSTINKDTPAGQLTLSRARQVSLPAWKPPKKKKGKLCAESSARRRAGTSCPPRAKACGGRGTAGPAPAAPPCRATDRAGPGGT